MADKVGSLSIDKLKELLHERGVLFKRSAPRSELEQLYLVHAPTPAPISKAPPRPKSPSRGRKSTGASEPPTPKQTKHIAAHASPPKQSPSSGSPGGARVVSVLPLRPPDSTDGPADQDEVPVSKAAKTASPRKKSPSRGRVPSRRTSRAASPPRMPVPPPRHPSPPVGADESTPEQVPLPEQAAPVAQVAQVPPAAVPAARSHEQPPPADYSQLLFWAIVIAEVALTIAALHFGFAFYSALTTPPNFCDTGVQGPDCIPCPPHGTCTNGALTCDEGFTQHGIACIEDERVTRLAFRVGSTLRSHLRQLDGDAVCTGGSIPVTLADEAAKEFVERRQAAPLVAHVWERLMRRAADMELVFEHGHWSTTAAPARSFSCQFSLLIRNNLLTIVLVCALLVLALWAYVWQAREARNHALVQATFLEALTQLAETTDLFLSENPGQAFSVSHIRDQVARRGSPQAHLWRRVEEAVESDSRVGKGQQMMGGYQTTTWQWQAGPLSPRRSPYR